MKKFTKHICLVLVFLLATFYAHTQTKVIAYYPGWTGFPAAFNAIDLTKITHLNVAFYNPSATGTFTNSDDGLTPANIATIVTACHAKNVKVAISFCGATNATVAGRYKTILSNNTLMNTFITNIVNFAVNNNLDGVDVDIEGDVLGSYVTSAQYQTFIVALTTALHAQNKYISAALASWFINNVTNTAAQSFDFIGLMSYDAALPSDPAGQHSPYQLALDDLAAWKAKGVASSKLIIGLPFYGYGWGTYGSTDEISYCTIVSTYSGAETKDQVGSGSNVIYYNGIPTIKQKTTYAMANAGGVMIWQATEDCPSSNAKSLLAAIDQVVKASVTPAPTITFSNISKTYGDTSFNMTATSNSSGAITYAVLSGTGATITSAGAVTITGAGTITIQASQVAATGYTAGTQTATLTITKKALTVTADNKTRTFNTANPSFTITYSGFIGNETVANLTKAATATTTAISSSNVGTYSIVPSGATALNYSFNYVNGTLTISSISPTITFANVNKTYGDATFNMTATSNSSGTITYSVLSGTGATITSAGVVTITGAGSVSIQASQVANGNYSGGTSTSTLTIAKKVLTVTADSKTKVEKTANPIFTISYTGFVGNENTNNLKTIPINTCSATLNSPVGTYNIIPSGGIADNYSFNYINGTLTITTITAIDNTSLPNSTVFISPNPFSTSINIKSDVEIVSLEILNANGQIISSTLSSEKELQIQTENFVPGLYILKIGTTTSYSCYKLTK